MADIKVVDSQGEQIQQAPMGATTEPEATLVADGVLLVERVAQMFDLKPSEVSKHQLKLKTLIDYAKGKTTDHSPEGLKWAIRSLGTKLGTPPLGEGLINYLHRFAYLELESRKIEAEKEKFLNAN